MMRLLNARTKTLELPLGDKPPYAIVSHRWGAESDEVLFTDINDPSRARSKPRGYAKMCGACAQARYDGIDYVWLDTCCIDKRNEKELTTAINSMYGWYQESEVCYAYLHDVSNVSEFTEGEWFLRGWTLQELIAPRTLKFFAKDWTLLGTREELMHLIVNCTGIKSEILEYGMHPHDVSIAQRMHWAARRTTTEEEDRAYSLLGLFDVHLPAIYGIKQKAFKELQHKIVSRFPDKSLFAWKLTPNDGAVDRSSPLSVTGLLAASPSVYLNAYEIPCEQFYRPFGPNRLSRWECFSLKNGAVCVTLPIRQAEDPSVHEALLRCSLDPPQDPPQTQRPLVVYLKQDNRYGRFVRIHVPTSLRPLQDDSMASFTLEKVHVDEVSHVVPRNPPSRARTSRPLPQTPGNSSSASVSLAVEPDRHSTSMYQPRQNEMPEGDAIPSTAPRRYTLLPQDTNVTPTAHTAERARNEVPGDETSYFSTYHTMPLSGTSDPEDWPPSRRLPIRHPQGTKTINVIVCGEPGAGVGGVVNIIVGRDVVGSQTEFKCAAMTFTVHDITLNSRNLRIFYVIGPQDHRLDVAGYNAAIENTTKLAQSLCDDGGVHLLFCCMLRTKPNRNIHHLFYETLCGQNVPTVVLVTGSASVGKSPQVDLEGILCDDRTAISVVRPHTAEKRDDYERCVETVREFLLKYTAGSREAYCPRVGTLMHLEFKDFMSTSAKHALSLQASINSIRGSSVAPTYLEGRTGLANESRAVYGQESVVHSLAHTN